MGFTLADIGNVIVDVLFPFLNPILKFVENQADNIRFASDYVLDILKTLVVVLTGSALPFYMTMSFNIVLAVFVIRFLLFK